MSVVNHESSNTPLLSHHSSTDTTPLFEKSLTPSDVGKLNRLVIPKQHAEKHFPLNSSSSSDKGMLLSFEDDSGKCWRFRYSYWNSSQSYVLTKGWSRFVKDKALDPGDVVFFLRHLNDSQRLFIGCRRRSSQPPPPSSSNYSPFHPQLHHYYSHYGAAATAVTETHSIPSAVTVGNSRTVRLFGVNLECQLDDDGDDSTSAVEPPCPDDGYYGQNMYYYHLQTHPTMNIAFTGDTMKHVGDRR